MKLGLKTLVLLLSLLLLLSGCSSEKKQMQKVIGACAGYDVLYEELRYVTLTYKALFEDTYGEGIWDDPETAEQYRAELEETVWNMMLNNYAVLATVRAYMPDASLENEIIQKAVDREMDDAVTQYGGDKAFRDAMKEMFMTEHLLRFCLGVAELEQELLFVLADDLGLIENDRNEFRTWLNDGNLVYVQHIYIRNDEGDDPAANLALAEEARRRMILGEDIGSFIADATYNEDTANTAPYFLVRDVYTKELEDAALSLNTVGAVSRVADSGEGYYVFQRLEYTATALEGQLADLMNSWQWAKMEAMVDERRADIALELNDYGKSLDLLEIR